MSSGVSEPRSSPPKRLHIRFPQHDDLSNNISQDEETCEIVEGDKVTTVRFHDYAQVFSIPGLYNQLFGGPESETQCISPQVIAGLVSKHLSSIKTVDSMNPDVLRILDFGAGNGMIGEEIRKSLPLEKIEWQDIYILGWDILPEAKEATARERSGIYNDYIAADINERKPHLTTDRGPSIPWAAGFDILTTASALSFGDATVNAFKVAASLVRPGGLLVFNLNERFLDIDLIQQDGARNNLPLTPASKREGFLGLISDAVENHRVTILETKRYRHRLSVTGRELFYVAVVAFKCGDFA